MVPLVSKPSPNMLMFCFLYCREVNLPPLSDNKRVTRGRGSFIQGYFHVQVSGIRFFSLLHPEVHTHTINASVKSEILFSFHIVIRRRQFGMTKMSLIAQLLIS